MTLQFRRFIDLIRPTTMLSAMVLSLLLVADAAHAQNPRAQARKRPPASQRPATFTLANGLQVVVIPITAPPVVTQMIWYIGWLGR